MFQLPLDKIKRAW